MIDTPLNVDYTGKVVVVTAAREELIYKQKATDGSLFLLKTYTNLLTKIICKRIMNSKSSPQNASKKDGADYETHKTCEDRSYRHGSFYILAPV